MLGSLKAGATVALMIVAWSFATPRADAATFTVRDRSDLGGSARCTPGSATLCTLRAAIQLANETPGPDEIVLSPLVYEITLGGSDDDAAVGDLDIKDPVDIRVDGAGATIDGLTRHRVFDVLAPGTLTLRGITIRNASAREAEATEQCFPGGDAGGGGALCVRPGASAVLVDCNVSNSTAVNGGGAFVAGSITVTRGLWSGNTAVSVGGGIAVAPGATATLTDVTLAKNASQGLGGALAVFGTAARLTLVRSLVGAGLATDANSATQGGGIAVFNDGTATIENTTISGNSATQGGGGIYCATSGPCFQANNVTIARNATTGGSGGGVFGGSDSAGFPSVLNGLLADNQPDDCAGGMIGAPNLVETPGTCAVPDGEDPQLAALADNGGATGTHAIVEETPAVGQGDFATCLETDQRGEERGQREAGKCDLGAFEIVPDRDGDGVSDLKDKCPETRDDQGDTDGDGVGDACDLGPPDHRFDEGTWGDDDRDTVVNYKDYCPFTTIAPPPACGTVALPLNENGCTVEQECDCGFRVIDDPDEGRVEVPWRSPGRWRRCVRKRIRSLQGNFSKNCRAEIQANTLAAGAAQSCGKRQRTSADRDGDGVPNASDNCPRKFNPRQQNADEDTEGGRLRGNACDDDNDDDNIPDGEDKCPNILSCDNDDADSDGFGNECDECPWENTGRPKDEDGCEPGQIGKGAVEPPETCAVAPAPPDSDEGDIIDE